MEFQESSYQETYHGVYYERKYYDHVVPQLVIVFGNEFVLEAPLQDLVEIVRHEDAGGVDDEQHVRQQQQELFSVPEAYAIINPGTMMVHVEDASVASGAVMAPFGLEDIAHQAIASALVLVVPEVEAPEHGHLTRVRRHRLEERPQQHREQDVVKY